MKPKISSLRLMVFAAALAMHGGPAAAAENSASDAFAASVLSRLQIRFVVFGEMHGTCEEPQMFGEIVASAARSGRRIVVGLEFEDGIIGDFMKSDGGPAARKRLVSSEDWQVGDGRSSDAMLALIEQLRSLSHADPQVVVTAIKPRDTDAPGASQTSYEKRMAANLEAAAKDEQVLVFALVGNFHALRAPFPSDMGFPTFEPMAMHLPAPATLNVLFTTDGGEAWNCQETCGRHPMYADSLQSKLPFFRFMRSAYDATLSVGKVSASPPAK